MRDILIGKASESVFSSELLRQLYRFRYRVFKERLGWEVSTQACLESDCYDDLDPVYATFCCRGSLIGAFRLLPTTGPYMLRERFPDLLRGEPPPCAKDVWELSRFALMPAQQHVRAQATCSAELFELLRACYEFSRTNGIRELVMVTSVSMERLLRCVRIPLLRMGDGKTTQVGKVWSVGCRVEITVELGDLLLPVLPSEMLTEGAA